MRRYPNCCINASESVRVRESERVQVKTFGKFASHLNESQKRASRQGCSLKVTWRRLGRETRVQSKGGKVSKCRWGQKQQATECKWLIEIDWESMNWKYSQRYSWSVRQTFAESPQSHLWMRFVKILSPTKKIKTVENQKRKHDAIGVVSACFLFSESCVS